MSPTPFIHDDFLLDSDSARSLFHIGAADLPIIDFHTHLSPEHIVNDHRFGSMTEIWLEGDHYKTRAMRASGLDERLCTGDASDWEKFEAWAATVPRLLRNPLHHWAHLELARFFGITDRLLGPDTARAIWDECNAKLATPELSCRTILKCMRVELVCTTDDPIDTLEHHRAIAADTSFEVRVLPTWRPDRAMAVEDAGAFNAYLDQLSSAADIDIRDFASFLEALRRRHAHFHAAGCRLSDHGLTVVPAEKFTAGELEGGFAQIRCGKPLSPKQILQFQSAMLWEFGVMNFEAGWTQQFHIGAVRSPRTRMLESLGPDTGFDTMGDVEVVRPLALFLDRLDRAEKLAPTILYNHNPKDTPTFITLAGSFNEGPQPGKMQVGPPWWFLDQRDGIERSLEQLSQLSLLSRFVGMVTDSRSFLSATRHEYFRRVLCNVLGRDLDRGLIPDDTEALKALVTDICHDNAARCFDFGLDPIQR